MSVGVMKGYKLQDKTEGSTRLVYTGVVFLSIIVAYFHQNKKGWNPRVKNVSLKIMMSRNPIKLFKKHPVCVS